jgi:hypothetical protein
MVDRLAEARRALEAATRWSQADTRASLLRDAKQQIFFVDEDLALGDISC